MSTTPLRCLKLLVSVPPVFTSVEIIYACELSTILYCKRNSVCYIMSHCYRECTVKIKRLVAWFLVVMGFREIKLSRMFLLFLSLVSLVGHRLVCYDCTVS